MSTVSHEVRGAWSQSAQVPPTRRRMSAETIGSKRGRGVALAQPSAVSRQPAPAGAPPINRGCLTEYLAVLDRITFSDAATQRRSDVRLRSGAQDLQVLARDQLPAQNRPQRAGSAQLGGGQTAGSEQLPGHSHRAGVIGGPPGDSEPGEQLPMGRRRTGVPVQHPRAVSSCSACAAGSAASERRSSPRTAPRAEPTALTARSAATPTTIRTTRSSGPLSRPASRVMALPTPQPPTARVARPSHGIATHRTPKGWKPRSCDRLARPYGSPPRGVGRPVRDTGRRPAFLWFPPVRRWGGGARDCPPEPREQSGREAAGPRARRSIGTGKR